MKSKLEDDNSDQEEIEMEAPRALATKKKEKAPEIHYDVR